VNVDLRSKNASRISGGMFLIPDPCSSSFISLLFAFRANAACASKRSALIHSHNEIHSHNGIHSLGFLSMLPSCRTYNDPLLVKKGAFHVKFTGNKSRARPGWRPPSE
jgi:hypothetical protein